LSKITQKWASCFVIKVKSKSLKQSVSQNLQNNLVMLLQAVDFFFSYVIISTFLNVKNVVCICLYLLLSFKNVSRFTFTNWFPFNFWWLTKGYNSLQLIHVYYYYVKVLVLNQSKLSLVVDFIIITTSTATTTVRMMRQARRGSNKFIFLWFRFLSVKDFFRQNFWRHKQSLNTTS